MSTAAVTNLEKARAALAEKRANGTVKKRRKKREPKVAPVTRFVYSDDGSLLITDGKNQWPLSIEETARLRAFLARIGEPAA